jgi:hypothetical protein
MPEIPDAAPGLWDLVLNQVAKVQAIKRKTITMKYLKLLLCMAVFALLRFKHITG